MTDHYRATDKQWAEQENCASCGYGDSSCIVELLYRIKALEATQHAHIEATAAEAVARRAVEHLSKPGSWQPLRAFTADEVAPIVVPTAEPAADAQQLTLVERVADAIGAADDEGLTNMTWSNHSRATLRVVAAWLRENPGPNSAWNAVARDLMDEANR